MKRFSAHNNHSKNKWKRFGLIALVVMTLLGLVAWNRFESWYQGSLEPIAVYGDDKIFTIPSGQTADEIGGGLEATGLIKSSRAFTIYLDRTRQRGSLQAGTYRLNPAMSTDEIAEIIASGDVDTRLVTFLPGLRVDEIADELVSVGFTRGEVDAALNMNYTHPLLFDKPSQAKLEGYIFPESFQFHSETKVEDLLLKSFDVFWDQVSDEMIKNIEAHGLSFHDGVILASIIAQESSDFDNQKKIARVFLNRLEQGIMLGSDVTFLYAAEIMGVEPSVDLDSPYNTRLYSGLPPGPIANFHVEALEAVANPANGSWLFFVSGDDGITRFSDTFEEHEANIDKYCFELCKL